MNRSGVCGLTIFFSYKPYRMLPQGIEVMGRPAVAAVLPLNIDQKNALTYDLVISILCTGSISLANTSPESSL
jgi:hypothetical protein